MTVESAVAIVPAGTSTQSAGVTTVVRPDGSLVQRQEMVIADEEIDANRAKVTRQAELVTNTDQYNTSRRMLEIQYVQQLDLAQQQMSMHANDIFSLTDRRGCPGRGSMR